jgi:adenylate kinase
MLGEAQRQGLAAERDELRALPASQRQTLREIALENLPKNCLLDIHLSTRTPLV